MTIAERILAVRERMKTAGGEDATLIAASKGASPEAIRQAFDAGTRDFGENYLQEALPKIAEGPAGSRWHYIGRLQANKIGKIAQSFSVIQTIDSVEKARAVSSRAIRDIDVFLEVNIADEPQKAGISPGNVLEIAEIVYALPNLRLIGLMTMGPENPNAEDARPYFIRMRKLLESLAMPGVNKLSMGMTADFEVAIQEGATHVRVGSGIFGPRTYR
jgi:pyridoxal phosphate enzyme (YggS family)